MATNLEDVRFGAAAFGDARRGWAAGYTGDVLYSDDGGAHWAARHTPTAGHKLLALTFHDARHGWGVGEFGTIAACAP